MTILYVILALLMLGIMILVHEAGHFFASRITGIPVKEFSIGFGPKLLQWKGKKHDTLFSVRLIIAGGYCMYYGEDDPNANQRFDKNDPRLLSRQGVWKRLFAIVMGPLMNFVLALVVCVLFVAFSAGIKVYDYSDQRPVILSVSPDSAAMEDGLEAGDILLAVNHKKMVFSGDEYERFVVKDDSLYYVAGMNYQSVLSHVSASVSEAIGLSAQSGQPVLLNVLRNGEEIEFSVMPRVDAQSGKMMLGITYGLEQYAVSDRSGIAAVLETSFDYMMDIGSSIIKGFKTLFSSWNNLTTMGSGPVGIVSTIATETKSSGLVAYMNLLIIISFNLGLVNLLPFPGLDGSRAVLLLLEAIRKKPLPQKAEAYIHLAGFAVLLGLILILTYHDILRIFGL